MSVRLFIESAEATPTSAAHAAAASPTRSFGVWLRDGLRRLIRGRAAATRAHTPHATGRKG